MNGVCECLGKGNKQLDIIWWDAKRLDHTTEGINSFQRDYILSTSKPLPDTTKEINNIINQKSEKHKPHSLQHFDTQEVNDRLFNVKWGPH